MATTRFYHGENNVVLTKFVVTHIILCTLYHFVIYYSLKKIIVNAGATTCIWLVLQDYVGVFVKEHTQYSVQWQAYL